jgi:hypothetical protein
MIGVKTKLPQKKLEKTKQGKANLVVNTRQGKTNLRVDLVWYLHPSHCFCLFCILP